jgi:predicted dehydrogenase
VLIANRYRVDGTLVFETWEQFHKASAESIQTNGRRLADAAIIAVQDHMHAELVVAFAAQGYDILCEKPMATSIEHCLQIEATVKKAGIIFGMGHGTLPVQVRPPLTANSVLVLRYSPYTRAVTDIIRSGQLGQLVNAQHIEPVGHWHFAHAYVRGNWSKEKESSFSLMTKSCQYVCAIRLRSQRKGSCTANCPCRAAI